MTSGQNISNHFPIRTTEIFDIEHRNAQCDNLANFPIGLIHATGGLINQRPIICGGESDEGFGVQISAKCYCYKSEQKAWKECATMTTKRYLASSIVVNDSLLWITGGRSYDDKYIDLDSTEFISTNGDVKLGTPLPNALSSHCMVNLNGSIMVVGRMRIGHQSKTLLYDTDTSKFTSSSGPTLITSERNFACAVFNSSFHGDRPVAIVTGGGQTEVWNSTKTQWEPCEYNAILLLY